jgi:hypothetical protein
MFGLVHLALVQAPDPTTGDYTVVVNSSLSCRLTLVPPEEGKDAHERAELAAMRRLLWGPSDVIAENVRFTIGGEQWAPVAGSFALVTGIGGQPVYRRAELVRAL